MQSRKATSSQSTACSAKPPPLRVPNAPSSIGRQQVTIEAGAVKMPEVSALGPVDPASVPEAEQEKAAPWIVRKLVGVSARVLWSVLNEMQRANLVAM